MVTAERYLGSGDVLALNPASRLEFRVERSRRRFGRRRRYRVETLLDGVPVDHSEAISVGLASAANVPVGVVYVRVWVKR